MLWIFEVFALSAGLYGCQIWAPKTLTFKSSATTKAHIHHVSFLKMLLGVKQSTNTHCLLRETGRLALYFYWFRCVARFWNSLLTSNNALLSKIIEADLRLAHRKGSWTFEVLSALHEIPGTDVHASAFMSRSKMTLNCCCVSK